VSRFPRDFKLPDQQTIHRATYNKHPSHYINLETTNEYLSAHAKKMSNLPRSQNARLSTLPSQKPRQLSHLQAQLAQLTANVADLENLMRMTAIQAQSMRELGGYSGGMYV
jgi:hypothetical protein